MLIHAAMLPLNERPPPFSYTMLYLDTAVKSNIHKQHLSLQEASCRKSLCRWVHTHPRPDAGSKTPLEPHIETKRPTQNLYICQHCF